ncbi:MAG: transporter substrate-binding protein [Paenibacillus sp.]|nr:transporter substrate-binding protein [Paenibacillus sp.]
MKKTLGIIGTLLLAVIALAGCGKDGSEPSADAVKEQKPVELSLYVDIPDEFSDDDINRYIREPLKKKHPHITIGTVIKRGTGTQREDVLATGEFPDLIYTSNRRILEFLDLGIPQDLTELAKKSKFDFNKTFDSVSVESLISLSNGRARIMGMPFSATWYTTFYNRDIFDKFAVAYPKEMMTWDEAIDLAKKLTRVDGGVQYIGLDAHNIVQAGQGLSLVYVDPVTLKSNFNTEPYRQVLTMYKSLFEIPGHVDSKGVFAWNVKGFFETQNVAIFAAPMAVLPGLKENGIKMRWDVTTALNFKEALGTEREIGLHMLMMSQASKHKEEAFQVMALTVSEDVQQEMAKNARVPAALQYPQFKDNFSANRPEFKDKNWAAMFKAKRRGTAPMTEYHNIAQSVLLTAPKRLAVDKVDVNTLMRELQEKADAAIAIEKEKKKK